MLVVSEISDGTTALRRQRLDVGTNVSTTSWKGIKIYEHLSRLLSGRVDFNKMLTDLEKHLELKLIMTYMMHLLGHLLRFLLDLLQRFIRRRFINRYY